MLFASHGNVDGMNLALADGSSINKTYHFLYTSPQGFSVSDSSFEGFTPLHFAIRHANLSAVKALVSSGADINHLAVKGGSPLFYAEKCLTDPIEESDERLLVLPDNKDQRVITARKDIIEFLSSCSAKEIPPSPIGYTSSRRGCAALVTGINERGERYVVLGKKQEASGKLSKAYLFPGGFEDYTDSDSTAAALREVKEETGIDLTPLIRDGKVKTSTLSQSELIKGKTLIKKTTILFDVGDALNGFKPHPKDDLAWVGRIPTKDFMVNATAPFSSRYTIKGNPLLASNGHLLASYLGIQPKDDTELAKMEAIEDAGFEMLSKAIKDKDYANAAWLIDNGAPTDSEDVRDSGIYGIAMKNPDPEAVKLLVDKGVPVDNKESLRFSFLSLLKKMDFAKRHWYSNEWKLCFDVLELLLTNTEKIQLTDKISSFARLAVDQNCLETLKLFVKHGANLKNEDPEYYDPLVYAVWKPDNEDISILRYLVEEQGLDINKNNLNDKIYDCSDYPLSPLLCPILVACKKGNLAAVKYLVSKGVRINEARFPESHENALQIAIQEKKVDVAKYLIEYETINLSYKDKDGRDAFDYCNKASLDELKSLLVHKILDQNILEITEGNHSFTTPQVALDDHHKATLEITFYSQIDVTTVAAAAGNATIRPTSDGGWKIRLGKQRLAMIISNQEAAAYLYQTLENTVKR
jgi:ankyrin repeat protein/8-oxo-dGTP pyrophosphatase MutT (NUDIX family)